MGCKSVDIFFVNFDGKDGSVGRTLLSKDERL